MSDTPETDDHDQEHAISGYTLDFCRKLERERDAWQIEALLKLAVKQLACMWCGELVDAPAGFESGTPLTEDLRGQAYREHVASCQKHPIRDVERERDGYQEQADALVDRLGQTQERMIDAERQRDAVSNAFVMAVDEMVQVQSQLREAKREFDEARDTVATMEIRHAAAMFNAQRVVDDANQLREQRDKLAAVLQTIRDGYGGQLAAPNCCEDCDFLLPIDEALQSITQNK